VVVDTYMLCQSVGYYLIFDVFIVEWYYIITIYN